MKQIMVYSCSSDFYNRQKQNLEEFQTYHFGQGLLTGIEPKNIEKTKGYYSSPIIRLDSKGFMGWREQLKSLWSYGQFHDIIKKVYAQARAKNKPILIVGAKDHGSIRTTSNESWFSYLLGLKFDVVCGKYHTHFMGALKVQRSPRQLVAETYFIQPENLPLRILDSVVVKKLHVK